MLATTKRAKQSRLLSLAAIGARIRLDEIAKERADLLRDFPELRPSPAAHAIATTWKTKRANATVVGTATLRPTPPPTSTNGRLVVRTRAEVPPLPPPLPKDASRADRKARSRLVSLRLRIIRSLAAGRVFKQRPPRTQKQIAHLARIMKEKRRAKAQDNNNGRA